LELPKESGRPFLFAFLAVVLLIFGIGFMLNAYTFTQTPPRITCVTTYNTYAGGSSSGGVIKCPQPIAPAKTTNPQLYFGEGLTILGSCFGLMEIWSGTKGR
jgi:hypothetical protein